MFSSDRSFTAFKADGPHSQSVDRVEFWAKVDLVRSAVSQRYAHPDCQPTFYLFINPSFLPSCIELLFLPDTCSSNKLITLSNLPIHPFIYPSNHPSILPFILSSIIHPSTLPIIHPSWLSIYQSFYLSTQTPISLSIQLFFHSSFQLPIDLSSYPSIHPSIHFSNIYPSICALIRQSTL